MVQKYFEKIHLIGLPAQTPRVKINRIQLHLKSIESFKINGTVHIFGKEFNYYQERILWHQDFFSELEFPLTFSKSINIRNNPNRSAKVVWEINRMQFLPLLALNYKINNNEKDLKQFVHCIRSWNIQNPYLKGVNWYSNIEVNIRLIVWFFCWNILEVDLLREKDANFNLFVENEWLPCIYNHCIYSRRNPSKFSSANNHLVSEYAGLFIASSLWKFPKSEKWNRYAKNGLEREIVRQYSSTGINKEEAAEYIQFITDFFLIAFVVGEKTGNNFSSQFENQLKQIFKYIDNFLDVNGNFPKYGDEDDGKCIFFTENSSINNFKSLVQTATLLFDDFNAQHTASETDIKNKILFGDRGEKKAQPDREKVRIRESIFYKNEGHFIFRGYKNKKEIYFHFNAAPLGFLSIAAHGHADCLSFILHINGSPFFVDPGTYTYHTEFEWRKYFVGTLAHNTVRVNRKNQAQIAGPTLWLNHYKTKVKSVKLTEDTEVVEAQHDGYSKFGVIHKREIIYKRNIHSFQIIDTIECEREGQYFIEIPFHLHPEVQFSQNGNNTFIVDNEKGEEAELKVDKRLEVSVISGQTNPHILGWYSKSFMVKEPSKTIYCTVLISNTETFQTTITIN